MIRALALLLPLAGLAGPAQAGQGAGIDPVEGPNAWVLGGTEAPPEAPWWTLLGDPALARVVDEVLAQNLDLATARERIRQARFLRDQTLSAVLPQVSFDGSINANPANRRFVAFTGEVAEDVDGLYYQATTGFNVGLEIDLFGKGILSVQAAGQDVIAGEEDQADLAMQLANRVALAWYDVAVQSRTLTLIEDQVRSNENLLEVASLRLDRGEASAIDVLQQRQQLAATRARLPLATAGRKAALVQLTTLLGRAPDDLPSDLPTTLPSLGPAPSAPGVAALDAARPDLRAADARLRSAWQRRMSAERQFLPTLRVSANAGWSFTNNAGSEGFGGGFDAAALLGPLYGDVIINREAIRAAGAPLDAVTLPDFGSGDDDSSGFQSWFNWGMGAQISVPLVLGGRNIAGLRAARASERIAAQTLQSKRLAAWGEVDSALQTDASRAAYVDALSSQAQDAQAAFEAARSRYAEGVGDYLTLLSTLVASQNADLALVQARRDALGARITLHDALGGAWTRPLAGGAP